MAVVLKPHDPAEVQAAVQWALAEHKTLELIGGGSKRGLGRAAQWDATLDLSGLSGVTLYEPEELVLSARAGTPLAEIAALTAAQGQELAFEPMELTPLLGGGGSSTLGGVLAANVSGPRRLKAGAARDHFLGFHAVSGRGEIFKSGGRVVKNVTGYDLCKLMAGSFGTLAALTEVTVKVLPRAETEASLLVMDLDPARAVTAMTVAMGSSAEVSGAAHLPARVADTVLGPAGEGRAVTALRLEGVAPSVAHRKAALERLLSAHGALTSVRAEASQALWRAVRDVTPFALSGAFGGRVVWRLSVAPSRGAALAAAIAAASEAEFLFDWAGGLVWAALPPSAEGGVAAVRQAVAAAGGHATLIRGPAPLRAAIDVFEPAPPGIAALNRRVKAAFDPEGILNFGRMWPGL